MFARVASQFKSGSRAFSAVRAHVTPKSRGAQWVVASSTIAGFSFYILSQKPVHSDASRADTAPIATKQQITNVGLSPLVWGSNQNRLIAPERSPNEFIKSPTYFPELFTDALRDLALSHGHAACVDAGGNVYQWGDDFFGSVPTESRRPRLTLRGKNIVQLALTPKKVFALSASGKVYVLSSSLGRQLVPRRSDTWWSFFGSNELSAYSILDTDASLHSGEWFTSISSGSDHLLALTSRGRMFAHPVTRLGNWHGQLGLRKITVQDPEDSYKRLPVELLPKISRDGLRKNSMPAHEYYRSIAEPLDPIDDKVVGFCGRLFEIPALRGIEVKQIAAGDRTSFAVTRSEGRVLAWGANEYGQLGLGANVTLPSVSVPTEVVLSKFTDRSTTTRCVDIASGGDLTFFTVERGIGLNREKAIDVLACGNGQWGGLGNATFTNSQGIPSKVKLLSGALEFDEKTQSLQPLRPYNISLAPGLPNTNDMTAAVSGHVIATLDTIPHSHPSPRSGIAGDAADSPGRDVLAWGLNQHYQLGNGKRSSVNVPVSVPTGDGSGRLMCKVSRETAKDLEGHVVKKKVDIEQRAVAGPGVSVIYWRIKD